MTERKRNGADRPLRRSARVASAATPRSQLLAHSLPTQLVRARDAVMQRFRPHLNAHGVTDQQWRVLRALAEAEALEIGDLAARCCIHPASLSRILPRLDEQGLTAREMHAQDKRRIMVAITLQGRRLFETVAPDSDAVYGEISRKLGSKRLQEVHRLLDEVIRVLDQSKPDRG